MMNRFKRLYNAFIWNYLNKISGYLLDFILSIVLARGLGSYGYGVYSEFFNLVFLFSLIASLGLDTTVNVFIPKLRSDAARLSSFIRKSLILIILWSLLVALLLALSRERFADWIHSPEIAPLLLMGAIFLVFYTFINLAQFIFLSLYRAKIVFWITLALKGGFILSASGLFFLGRGLLDIIALFSLVSLILSVFILLRLWPLLLPAPVPVRYFKYMKFGFNAWIIKFLNYFLGRYFDIFILGLWGIDKAEISYFNIALSITLALSYFFTSGFSGISMAFFSEYAQDKSRITHLVQGWLVVTKFAIFFCIPAFIFVIFNARQLILLIYSDPFIDSAPLLQTFATFFLLTMILGSGINSTVLFSMEKDRIVLRWRTIWGLANVILDILFVQIWQTTGVVIATGISTLGIIGCEFFSLRSILGLKYPVLYLLKIFAATIVSTVITFLLPSGGWIELFLRAGVFVVTLVVALWVIKPFTKQDRDLVERFSPALEKFMTSFSLN